MNLEEILATPRERLRVSGLDFDRLKKDALERAASLGYEVVVIDFGNSDNIYDPNGKHGWGGWRQYAGRKVLFFHENVDKCRSSEVLGIARSHAQLADRGQENHIFITTFTNESKESPLHGSPYSNAWGKIIKPTEEIRYLEGKLKELKNAVADDRLYFKRDAYVNLVGAEHSGKTTLLQALCKKLSFPRSPVHYNTMQEYQGIDNTQVLKLLLHKNQETGALILDEANLVSEELHKKLIESRAFKVIIYASHVSLPFEKIAEIKLDYNADRKR